MPVLIHRLPFGTVSDGASLPVPMGDPVPLIPDRIFLWVSVTAFATDELPTHTPIFPAVLESGFNNDFLIQQSQLMSWTSQGVYEHCFRNNLGLQVDDEVIPLWDAAVWIHPNRPGTREIGSGPPFCLDLPTGIAVTGRGSLFERPVPILGLSAVRFSNLRVHIDGRDETVTVEVP